ncbi:hypothetical protein B0H10DRAFT_2234359 [Mycena sp. CBHHK59/15]|nr:hypothetical protein B0H10DRAFT_2234359 [Mycena sp. CBHHK59/15]
MPPKSKSSSGSKRKRGNSPPGQGSARSSKRPRGPMPPSAKKANKSQYHLSKADVPNDQKSLQNAMNLHIHILLNATSSLDVPAIPNAATVASFQQMFSSAQDIHNHAANISYNHQDTTANITKLRSGAALQPGSTIAKNIAQVDDHILHTIFSAVRHFGLLEWRPDIINGTPGTLYNVMHEVIALKTFQTVAIAGNAQQTTNISLLIP